MWVEVQHGSVTYHTQKVRFVDGDTTVLETSVPLKNGYVSEYTPIELDLTEAAAQLAEQGYTFDQAQTYTCICNNYYHNPKVTEIEVTKGAHTHTWNDGKVTKEATCEEAGVKTYTCTVCGETKTEEIAATGHTEVVDVAVAATCTEKGLTEGKHCSVCDKVLVAQKEIAALGHTWDNGKITKEPTETETGVKTYTCEVCGETKTEEIPVLGHEHAYGDWVSDGAETHSKSCVCGDKITEAHTWDDGKVTKEPTTTETGIKTYTCTVCGETRTEEIPVQKPDLWFEDVAEDAWYYDAVYECAFGGLMKGTSATKFSPDLEMSRAMLATVLYRIAREPEVTFTKVFDDVEEGTWYSDAIVWANNVGIVKGYDNGSFGVRDNVTREQMVTMLYRYLEMEEYEFEEITEDLDGFVDKDQVSSYAVEAMRWAVQSGLVEGMGHDDLNPKGFAIRAQVATLLVRFCDIVEA